MQYEVLQREERVMSEWMKRAEMIMIINDHETPQTTQE